MLDIEPATTTVARIVEAIRDDQLDGSTPCTKSTVGALLDHLDGLSQAFTAAARKTPLPGPPSVDANHLAVDWRTSIPARLAELAKAWQDPDAWQGRTAAGGIDLPGEIAGVIALDEVVVHGWDIAVATGQDYDVEPALLAATHGFVQASVEENPDGTPGLFGPPVPVAADASPLDKLIGLTGRDPSWRPA
jgi:uncharacterized protein (TIGR03086 family)